MEKEMICNVVACEDALLNRQRFLAFFCHVKACVVIACLIAFAGCGSEARVPVFPVSGKVAFQGKPPAGAIVVLNPVGATTNDQVVPTGTVGNDGSFTLTAYEPGDGAPHGDYVATIQWYKVTKEAGGPGPNVIPKTYSNPKSSPVKVSVGDGPLEIPAINIK
jgi:hypothetical protein